MLGFLLWVGGCTINVDPPATRPICREAGFSDAEVQDLLPDLQSAHDAGVTREQVLQDIAAACAVCAEADHPCVQTACVECFTVLVDEVYAVPLDQVDESPRRR